MRSARALSACLGKLVRGGSPEENAWEQAQLLAHIAGLESELARYVAKHGLTPEARRLFAQPPLPAATLQSVSTKLKRPRDDREN